jgi:hypothetical protein
MLYQHAAQNEIYPINEIDQRAIGILYAAGCTNEENR